MNLITNASEAIGDRSGVISITVGAMQADHASLRDTYLDEGLPEGLYVTLEVSDTGCGMNSRSWSRSCEGCSMREMNYFPGPFSRSARAMRWKVMCAVPPS